MYSISGMIINELQKNKKNSTQRKMNVPEFTGVLEVKHALPGRIRFYVPSIQGDVEKGEFLLTSFGKIEGIEQIEMNYLLGTVLVKYNENHLQPVLIMGIIIKLLGLEAAVQKQPKSLVNREMKNVTEAVNSAVYNKTKGVVDVVDLLLISLTVLGVYRIRRQPNMIVGGTTLLWWAYSLAQTPR